MSGNKNEYTGISFSVGSITVISTDTMSIDEEMELPLFIVTFGVLV